MAVFEMLDPTVQPEGATAELAERPADLRGRRLVLMDNGKHNARQLLEEVFAILEPDLAPSEVTWRSVPTTLPGDGDLLDDIARRTDFVIEAVGD